jgi:hypothetical protein
MSRPIAYNASGPLSGSIRGGNVNYTVDSGNRDYTTFASKKWVPSADGAAPIVFVTDSYTQGFEGNPSLAVPLFYSCNGTGSAAIIYTANRIPGSPGNYSDANVALNDLITARGYFILESNDPYQGVNADNLAFDVDASKMSSYPQTGTNWRDLSGKGTNGTLTNGPTWNSNGYFAFDGTDDYVNFPNDTALNSDSITVSSTFSPALASQNGFLFEKGYVNTQYALFFENPTFKLRFMFNGIGMQDFQVGSSTYFIANRWYNTIVTYDGSVAKMYINGTNVLSTTYNATIQVNNNGERIGSWYNGSTTGYHFNGSIANTQVYPRALTEAQVKQNYFGAPIVTDGLVFAVDANNIVSYPKSGTAWYNLTGSVGNGALTNGPTFNINNGGSIVFDGTDDYVNFGSTGLDFGTGNFNVSCWIKTSNQSSSDYMGVVSKYDDAAGTGLWIQLSPTNRYVGFGWDGGAFLISTTSVNNGAWRHISCQRTGATTAEIYVDGVLVSSGAGANTNSNTTVQLDIGRINISGRYFDGTVANTKIYNKALSASEILQNYQAEQYRFETPAGPVTNGLVLNLEADNLDSYPGTGTTWYDISGNGNNVAWLQNPVGGTNGNSQINWNQVPGGGMFNWNPTNSDTDYFFRTDTTTSLPTGNPNYSIEIVANMLNNGNNWHLFAYGQQNPNQSNGIYYNVGADGLYKYYFGNDYVMVPNFSSNVGFGNNFHYVETYNPSSSNLRCYLNNNLIVNVTVSPTPNITLYSSGRLDIGGGVITDDRPAWAGKMGICRLYNRTLSSTEVTQNYNAIKSQYGV